MDPAALVLPTQFPACQPVPVTMPTLSEMESFARAAVALLYASSQVRIARFEFPDGMAVVMSFHPTKTTRESQLARSLCPNSRSQQGQDVATHIDSSRPTFSTAIARRTIQKVDDTLLYK
jgi:hypothetical protein